MIKITLRVPDTRATPAHINLLLAHQLWDLRCVSGGVSVSFEWCILLRRQPQQPCKCLTNGRVGPI